MFCKNCGNQIADTAAFCNKCGTPVNGAAAAPVATPVANFNLKALILKGVSALFFILTLIFYSGNTISVSYWGQSQSGPMAQVLENAEGGFINVIATILYIVSLILSILALAMPFISSFVPATVSKLFGKKVVFLMILSILSLVVYFFGFIACLSVGSGMNVSFSGLGVFNLILHIAQIVLLVLISKENKKSN